MGVRWRTSGLVIGLRFKREALCERFDRESDQPRPVQKHHCISNTNVFHLCCHYNLAFKAIRTPRENNQNFTNTNVATFCATDVRSTRRLRNCTHDSFNPSATDARHAPRPHLHPATWVALAVVGVLLQIRNHELLELLLRGGPRASRCRCRDSKLLVTGMTVVRRQPGRTAQGQLIEVWQRATSLVYVHKQLWLRRLVTAPENLLLQ